MTYLVPKSYILSQLAKFPGVIHVSLRRPSYGYKVSHFPADFGRAHRFSAWLQVDFGYELVGRNTKYFRFSFEVL